ncbi:hypothetical protein ACFLSK_01255 [Chloroflexota bacterium]
MSRGKVNLSDAQLRQVVDDFLRDAKENSALAWYIAACLTFKDTEKLLEHTKVLKCWTIVIAIFTVILGASTIIKVIQDWPLW